jgi:hypothetical protein
MERFLQQILHSPAHRGFSFLIGSKALSDSLAGYQDTPKYQRLVIDFEAGENPDDAYSRVPYEKGANFLLHLGKALLVYLLVYRLTTFYRTNTRRPRRVFALCKKLCRHFYWQEYYN